MGFVYHVCIVARTSTHDFLIPPASALQKSQQPFEMELFSCKPSREGDKAAWTAYMLTTNDKFDAMDGAKPVPPIRASLTPFFVTAQILSIKAEACVSTLRC